MDVTDLTEIVQCMTRTIVILEQRITELSLCYDQLNKELVKMRMEKEKESMEWVES